MALSLYMYKINDMVCFAGYVHEQLTLNTLHEYASLWDLAICTYKTKTVVLGDGGKILGL